MIRYILAILAIAGIVVSSLALHVHYSTETEPCDINAKWDCGIVNHSPFRGGDACPGGGFWHCRLPGNGSSGAGQAAPLALVLAVGALGFSLYLTYIEKYVLEVYCLYCVASLAIIVVITALALGWSLQNRRSQRA